MLISDEYYASARIELKGNNDGEISNSRFVHECCMGGLKSLKTLPLMEFSEGLEAVKKAGEVTYSPPGE
tara:strand:- start:5809 stop:6015 length:207 start_codon:yes stop_codon:yes gene_type:complete